MGSSACPAPGAGPSAASPSPAVAASPGRDLFGAAADARPVSDEAGSFFATAWPAVMSPVESHMAAGGEEKTSVALPSVADMPPSSVSSTFSPDDVTAYSIRSSAGLLAASGVLTTRT